MVGQLGRARRGLLARTLCATAAIAAIGDAQSQNQLVGARPQSLVFKTVIKGRISHSMGLIMFTAKKPDFLLKSPKINAADQQKRAADLGKVVQAGIAFPSPSAQTQLLIVRIDLAPAHVRSTEVSSGLAKLCQLFADIDAGKKKISVLSDDGRLELVSLPERFHFSATIGFGEGFFTTLGIPESLRPSKLKPMPDHEGLGDTTPYSLGQTDLLLQLGSSSSFVNRWVLENSLQPSEAEGAGCRRHTARHRHRAGQLGHDHRRACRLSAHRRPQLARFQRRRIESARDVGSVQHRRLVAGRSESGAQYGHVHGLSKNHP